MSRTRNPELARVTFQSHECGVEIYRDGAHVGHISSGSEAWVSLLTPAEPFRGEFAARFKYARARLCAKSFIKFVLERMTPAEYLAAIADRTGPANIAEAMGWINPNIMAGVKLAWQRRESSVLFDVVVLS